MAPTLPGLLRGAGEGLGSGGPMIWCFRMPGAGRHGVLEVPSLSASAPISGALRHSSMWRDQRSGPENPNWAPPCLTCTSELLGQWSRLATHWTGTPPAGQREHMCPRGVGNQVLAQRSHGPSAKLPQPKGRKGSHFSPAAGDWARPCRLRVRSPGQSPAMCPGSS